MSWIIVGFFQCSSKIEVKSKHSVSSVLSLTYSLGKSNGGHKERLAGTRNTICLYLGRNCSKSYLTSLLSKESKGTVLQVLSLEVFFMWHVWFISFSSYQRYGAIPGRGDSPQDLINPSSN